MRGDWLKGEGPWAGDAVNGTGMGDSERGTGDDRSDPGKHRQENSTDKSAHSKPVQLISLKWEMVAEHYVTAVIFQIYLKTIQTSWKNMSSHVSIIV